MNDKQAHLFIQLGLTRFYYSHVRQDRIHEFTPERPEVLSFWKSTYKRLPLTIAPLLELMDHSDNWNINSIWELHDRLKSISEKAEAANAFAELSSSIRLDSIRIEGTCTAWQSHIAYGASETLDRVKKEELCRDARMQVHEVGLPQVNQQSENIQLATNSMVSIDVKVEDLRGESDPLQACMKSRELVNEYFYSLLMDVLKYLPYSILCLNALHETSQRLVKVENASTEVIRSIQRLRERVKLIETFASEDGSRQVQAVKEHALRFEEEHEVLLRA